MRSTDCLSRFINPQRLVYIDFGIKIRMDLTRLRLSKDGIAPFDFVIGKVEYPAVADAGNQDPKIVRLLYLKWSGTGNELPPIMHYIVDQEEFPHESTVGLYYDEAQFEAYRAPRYHIAREVFREELAGTIMPSSIED